jgi:hypothetical protein
MKRLLGLLAVITLLISGTGNVLAEIIVFSNSNLNAPDYRIRQYDNLGGNLSDVVLGSGARQIALDLQNSKMYWGGGFIGGDSGIFSANLDGSDVRLFLESADAYGVALDVTAGRIYWAGPQQRKIQSARLSDGGDIRDVVVGLTQPRDLALDLVHGMVYWAEGGDRGVDAVRRASLSGGPIQDLVRGWNNPAIGQPNGIALDVLNDRLYYSDLDYGRIFRASLDGSNRSVLVSGLGGPMGLFIDRSWLYWVDDKIQRSRLDGTMIEDVVTTGLLGSLDGGIAVYPSAVPEPSTVVAFASLSLTGIGIGVWRRRQQNAK